MCLQGCVNCGDAFQESGECSIEVKALQAKLKKAEKHVDNLTKEKHVLMEMSNNLKSCLDRATGHNANAASTLYSLPL